MVSLSGPRIPDLLVTDTVGFIQKLPTNLVAAFRATLEEISDADILLHVTDVSSSSNMWLKQEAAVLRELTIMGLQEKPIVTIWNKVDKCDAIQKDFFQKEALKRPQTVVASAVTGEGLSNLVTVLEHVIASTLEPIAGYVDFEQVSLIHKLGILDEVVYEDDGVYVRGKIPLFLKKQFDNLKKVEILDMNHDNFDWVGLARGRHTVLNAILSNEMFSNNNNDANMDVYEEESILVTIEEDLLISDTLSNIVKNKNISNNEDELSPSDMIVDEKLLLDYDAGEFWHLKEDMSQRKLNKKPRNAKMQTRKHNKKSTTAE